MKNRVVITGMDLLTPLGNGPEDFFDAALAGRCSITKIRKFDTSKFPVQIGGELCLPLETDTVASPIPMERLSEMPAVAKWAVIAARRAVLNAGLEIEREDSFSIGVILGVGAPAFDVLEEQFVDLKERGPAFATPRIPIMLNPAAAAVQVSIDLGLHGEVVNISTACSSSANAIGYALRLIQQGSASCVLTGGVDEGINPLFLGAFGNGSILSRRNDDPVHASRPFDRQRDGYILSDAACILVLEEYDRALARGANVYCEITGFGASSDGVSPMKVGKSEEHGARALEKALTGAQRTTADIDYYCAHGSSSHWTDIRETRMIKRVFRERASRLPVSSVKSMMGHPLGAAGAVQTAASALAIRHGAVPPTINYEEHDPECDLDYIPNQARSIPVRNALVYSLGNGGNNTALVLSAC